MRPPLDMALANALEACGFREIEQETEIKAVTYTADVGHRWSGLKVKAESTVEFDRPSMRVTIQGPPDEVREFVDHAFVEDAD